MEDLSRNEALLDALVNGTTPPEIEPKSRMEAYLQALLEKGVSGGSGGSGVNWKTFKDSYGNYTYAVDEKTIDYEIAQTITNTSGNGSLSALEDIVSWLDLLKSSHWTAEPQVNTLSEVVKNFKALKTVNSIKGTTLTILYPDTFNKENVGTKLNIAERTSYGSTHLINTISHTSGITSEVYYNSEKNIVTKWSSRYIGVTESLNMAGKPADAKVVGDALDTKITTPENSSVGQVLAVKEVDDNGKPIEWECAEMSTGGVELTSPNGTRYRIIVADDGTLTTTAI